MDRLQFQSLMTEIPGVAKVYHQRPENVQLEYPCILYGQDYATVQHADDIPYMRRPRYQVTLITRDPNDPIENAIADMPMAAFDRRYTASQLHHIVYNVYI